MGDGREKGRVIRDPIHGYIHVDAALGPIVDHPLFQRLRRVSQTSLASNVYPSITGMRFEHGLGTMLLAQRGWAAAWGSAANESRTRRLFIEAARREVSELSEDHETFGNQIGLAVGAAALLHDVGHPPFSHALEEPFRARVLANRHLANSADGEALLELEAGELPFHDFAGRLIRRQIVRDVFVDGDGALAAVKLALLAITSSQPNDPTWSGALHSIVAGEVDVDRLDYLIRDSYRAGTEFGAIDHHRLVDALELHWLHVGGRDEFRVAPGVRARSAVETLLVQRLQTYQWMHFHPRVVGFNLALRRAMELILAMQQTASQDPTPAEVLIRRLQPNTVYWIPTAVDVSATLGIPATDPSTDGREEPLFGLEVESQLTRQLSNDRERLVEAQASVDDATVVEIIKRAYFATAADESLSTDEVRRVELAQLRTFTRAVLFRSKNFVPAWKTAEEYEEAAEQMRGDLVARIGHSLSAGRARGEHSRNDKVLAEMLTKIQELSEENAVVGLNAIVDLLLSVPANVRFVAARLNRNNVLAQRGFWDLSYIGYGLRKAPATSVELYVGDKPVRLADRSPLVRAIGDAERSRVKLHAFYFSLSHDFGGRDRSSAQAHRRSRRDELCTALPEILQECFDEGVRPT
ncbi:MAG TPA: HD domain-containing protein [Gaiellaceae bacterium]|nr:HD domain-containing protein [Gaiellaceae bacterium]